MTDPEILANIGRNIRFMRKVLRYTQTEFANITQIDRNTIGQIERGERKLIGVIHLCKIAKALGLTPGELFKGIK